MASGPAGRGLLSAQTEAAAGHSRPAPCSSEENQYRKNAALKEGPAEKSRRTGSAEGRRVQALLSHPEEGKGEETHAQGRTWKQQMV